MNIICISVHRLPCRAPMAQMDDCWAALMRRRHHAANLAISIITNGYNRYNDRASVTALRRGGGVARHSSARQSAAHCAHRAPRSTRRARASHARVRRLFCWHRTKRRRRHSMELTWRMEKAGSGDRRWTATKWKRRRRRNVVKNGGRIARRHGESARRACLGERKKNEERKQLANIWRRHRLSWQRGENRKALASAAKRAVYQHQYRQYLQQLLMEVCGRTWRADGGMPRSALKKAKSERRKSAGALENLGICAARALRCCRWRSGGMTYGKTS